MKDRIYPGIAADDPIKPLLDGLYDSFEAMDLTCAAVAASVRGMSVLPSDAVAKLGEAAASGAQRGTMALARAHNRRTLLTYGGAFVVGILAAGGGGFWWGLAVANASVQQTEQRLALAFRDGPSAAASWVNLMRANDAGLALAACTGTSVKTIEGRRACSVPLWLDPPNLSAPVAR